VGSGVGEAYEDISTIVLNVLYAEHCVVQPQPKNKARVRCREAAFPKMFMSNNL
jgi:hypothetical protein